MLSLIVLMGGCGEVQPGTTDGPVDGPGDTNTGGCVSETDSAFCMRLGKSCSSVTNTDNCGAARTVSCGVCSPAQVCRTNVCQVVACAAATYTTGTPIADLNMSMVQDVLAGATPSASTVLVVRRANSCSGQFQLFIADESAPGSGSYLMQELTALPNFSSFLVAEQTLALTGDGNTIIGVATDNKGFVVSTRSGATMTDFDAPTNVPLQAISFPLSSPGLMSAPVISADGLAFYYRVSNLGAQDGVYESVRASTSDSFPVGTLMAGEVQMYSIDGISTDRLALFVEKNFASYILRRGSIAGTFINPNAPNLPPSVPGFRPKPLHGCARVLVNATTSGCPGEDISIYQ